MALTGCVVRPHFPLSIGFSHSAFTFAHESASINKSTHDPNKVPPGALVGFVQKGMQLMELEANVEVGVSQALLT